MRYESAAAFRMALEQRMKTEAERTGSNLTRLRKRVAFEQFVVDIGFGKPASSEPDKVRTSDFLSFAGIEPLELPAIPLAQHLAEKVHAYTRSYGTAGRPSTRPKDLIDILLIADSQSLEAATLRRR